MTRSLPCLLLAALFALPGDDAITLDFAKEKLPDGWTLSSKEWKVAGGELVGLGDGKLCFAGPVVGDFTLTFSSLFAEKTSLEIKLYDAVKGDELYTFGFGGRYHSVLDGVKSCILRKDYFVKVDPKMWIFPGRKFTFEVRVVKGQFQMFLDGELGPLFIDPQPLIPETGVKLEIIASTEGSKDKVTIDDVKLVPAAKKK